jgi:hypothetical protein
MAGSVPGSDRSDRNTPRTRPSRVQTRAALFALLVAGSFLRFSTIDSRGLWVDEAVTIHQTTRSLGFAIASQIDDIHPPLFHILTWAWIRVWGAGEVAVRSLSTLFGIAAILAAAWVGTLLFDRRAGLLAACVVTFSPFHIWYSQEARMYSMLFFFSLMSLGFFALAIKRNRLRDWFGYAVMTACGMFVHYFFLFLVAGEAAYFLLFEVAGRETRMGREKGPERTSLLPWRLFRQVPELAPWLTVNILLVAGLVAWMAKAVIFLPAGAPTNGLFASLSSSGLGYGHTAPSLAVRFNDVGLTVAQIAVGFHPGWVMYGLVAAWPLLVYLGMLLVDHAKLSAESALLLFAASGIFVIWAIGQWQGQILAARYMMPLTAPIVLLVARGLSVAEPRSMVVALVLGIGLMVLAWADQSLNPQNMIRYDDREAIRYVMRDYRPSDVILYEPFYMDAVFDYYLPRGPVAYSFPRRGADGRVRNWQSELGRDLDRIIGPSHRVWLVLGFQDVPQMRGDAYNTEWWLLRNGFHVARRVHLTRVQVLRFDGSRPGVIAEGGAR